MSPKIVFRMLFIGVITFSFILFLSLCTKIPSNSVAEGSLTSTSIEISTMSQLSTVGVTTTNLTLSEYYVERLNTYYHTPYPTDGTNAIKLLGPFNGSYVADTLHFSWLGEAKRYVIQISMGQFEEKYIVTEEIVGGNEFLLSVEGFSSGNYFWRVMSEDKTSSSKIHVFHPVLQKDEGFKILKVSPGNSALHTSIPKITIKFNQTLSESQASSSVYGLVLPSLSRNEYLTLTSQPIDTEVVLRYLSKSSIVKGFSLALGRELTFHPDTILNSTFILVIGSAITNDKGLHLPYNRYLFYDFKASIQIIKVFPEKDQIEVPLDSQIAIELNKDIKNKHEVEKALSVYLWERPWRKIDIEQLYKEFYRKSDANIVFGKYIWYDDHTLGFVPDRPLQSNENYLVRVERFFWQDDRRKFGNNNKLFLSYRQRCF